MMGKYDEHVLLWKFVNVIFKGCCHERHLSKIENYSMPLLLFLFRDMIRNNTVICVVSYQIHDLIVHVDSYYPNCWMHQ